MTPQSIAEISSETQRQSLFLTGSEVEQLLGISSTTRWRLEKKQLLMPVYGIRRKLYSTQKIEAFIKGSKGGEPRVNAPV